MKITRKALLSATVALAATGSALAQSDPAARGLAAPIPQHNCLLKKLSACKADGSCSPLDNLKGEKLPVKVTVDVEAGIVAGVAPGGWVDATRIGSVARTADDLILQGIDNAIAWRLLIYEKNEAMSFSLATPDTANVGFGDCTVAGEQ